MAFPAQYGSTLGFDRFLKLLENSGVPTTNAMPTANNGIAFIFKARSTKDIATVLANFSVITAAGTMTATIETVDESTMKPTGSLYDASATKTITPTTGWNAFTFASLPTAGLTVGNYYAVVFVTATGGTTHTMRAYFTGASAPNLVLTAADASTRANFAVVSNTTPVCRMVDEDSAETAVGFLPFINGTSKQVYGTNACGGKAVLSSSMIIRGYDIGIMAVTGTPTGIKAGLYSGSTLVSGSDLSIVTAAAWTGSASRGTRLLLPTPVTLSSGTYRLAVQQTDTTTTSGNRFNSGVAQFASNASIPSGWQLTSTTDITAGTISWSDDDTAMPCMGLLLDSIPSGGGGASGARIFLGF